MPRIPRLDQLYHWDEPDTKPPSPTRFDVDLDWSSAEWNRQLKRSLSKAWSIATHRQRLKLAHWIVSDWGGVKRNKPGTIEEHIERARPNNKRFPFKGIASYSKILTISNPEMYAIYDARVAASLNALQFLVRSTPAVYFPIPTGQNNTVRRFANTLPKEGSIRVIPDETYSAYLEALRQTCIDQGCTLTEVEMVLFAVASRLSRKEYHADVDVQSER